MADLRVQAFSGNNNYAGVFGTNIPKQEAGADPRSAAFYNVSSSSDSTENSGGGFTVQPGVSVLYGGIGDWTNGEVANASIWVETPSGVKIDQATPLNAEGQMVLLPSESAPSGSVLAFIIINPEPGLWNVGVTAETDASNFQVAVTTVAEGGIDQMITGFENLMRFDHSNDGGESDELVARSDTSWGCIGCKCVAYPAALALTAVVAAGLTTLTATSAIVVALTSLAAWITAPIAIAFITGLVTAGVVAVDFILTSLCDWLGACES